MKKWLALLLAMMMAFALAACGNTPKSEEFTRGTWDGNIYKNDSLGLVVTIPEGWYIATDDDLEAIMCLAKEMASQMNISEEPLTEQLHSEMMAISSDNKTNITIAVNDIDLESGKDYDEKAYITDRIDWLQKQGNTIGEESSVTINGRNYFVLPTFVPQFEMNQDYLITKIGSRMVSVVLSYSLDSTDFDTMLAMLGGK